MCCSAEGTGRSDKVCFHLIFLLCGVKEGPYIFIYFTAEDVAVCFVIIRL